MLQLSSQKNRLSITQQKDAYYLASVRFIGRTITSHETGLMSVGDDQGFAVATMLGDWADRADLKSYLDQYITLDASTDERDKVFEQIAISYLMPHQTLQQLIFGNHFCWPKGWRYQKKY